MPRPYSRLQRDPEAQTQDDLKEDNFNKKRHFCIGL